MQKKNVLVISGIVGLAALGGALWFGFGNTFRQEGTVLGEQTDAQNTVPPDAVFLLGGPAGDQLLWWRPERGVRIHPQFVGRSVATVTSTADGIVAALRQPRGTLLVTLPAGSSALAPLLALEGAVERLAASPNGRFVSVFQTRNGDAELDVVDRVSGRLTRVAEHVRAAAWLHRTAGILSYDAAGFIRYHGISMDGSIEPAQEIVQARTPPVVEPATDRVLLVPFERSELAAFDLATRAPRIIVPLPDVTTNATIQLTLSPSGQRVVLTAAPLTRETMQAPQQLLIDVRTGVSRALTVPGIVRTWYGEDALVTAAYENGQALLLTLPTDATTLLGDHNTHPLP